jgi:hypothetical protein
MAPDQPNMQPGFIITGSLDPVTPMSNAEYRRMYPLYLRVADVVLGRAYSMLTGMGLWCADRLDDIWQAHIDKTE